jgi:8-oxo-dGTP diphosphatase
MRSIQRDIVGAFIFSADGKVLLGHNKEGGTYQGQLVIPGGGIEKNETKMDAVKREVLEEIGLDISNASIEQLQEVTKGESEKTLKDTHEKVLMKMSFHDFKVTLAENAESIVLSFEDDFGDADWYTADDLKNCDIGPNTRAVLQRLHFLCF